MVSDVKSYMIKTGVPSQLLWSENKKRQRISGNKSSFAGLQPVSIHVYFYLVTGFLKHCQAGTDQDHYQYTNPH
jgi:hypothetical protein